MMPTLPEGPATSVPPAQANEQAGSEWSGFGRDATGVRIGRLGRTLAWCLACGLALGCERGSGPSREVANEAPSPDELAAIREDMASLRVKKPAPVPGAEQVPPVETPPIATAAANDPASASQNVALASATAAERNSGSSATANANATETETGLMVVARGAGMLAEAVPVTPTAREVKLLIPHKSFRQEGRDRSWRVSFDDIDLLKVLNMDPVTPDAVEKMPEWLRSLAGKRVRIRGFMYPPNYAEGIRRFPLARDNQICCFGRNPKLYDIIEVTLKQGTDTHYIENRPFDVVGTFRIELVGDDSMIGGMYYLDEAEVLEK
jgi:hypothetical protein